VVKLSRAPAGPTTNADHNRLAPIQIYYSCPIQSQVFLHLLSSPSKHIRMTRVFLGSLGDEVEEETLRSYCSGWGELYSCTLMLEPGTSNSRGFAFLTFKSRSSASSFLSSQPHFIGDRKLIVKPLEMTSGTATV